MGGHNQIEDNEMKIVANFISDKILNYIELVWEL